MGGPAHSYSKFPGIEAHVLRRQLPKTHGGTSRFATHLTNAAPVASGTNGCLSRDVANNDPQ